MVLGLFLTVPWIVGRNARFITLAPLAPEETPELPPYGGTRPGRGPAGGLGRPAPAVQAPVPGPTPIPVGVPDSALAANPPSVGPRLVLPPQPGDGRLWVSPRPALPTEVAEALYGEREARDSVAVRRLRVMVDSLNELLDAEQRERQRPTWTAEVEGVKFGIDSQYIHVAGIKIPTAALALLPISLPQGNYDEALRARHLQDMRDDLLRSARRAGTLQQFKQYVRELRARKQAERDAERARGDTAKVTP